MSILKGFEAMSINSIMAILFYFKGCGGACCGCSWGNFSLLVLCVEVFGFSMVAFSKTSGYLDGSVCIAVVM